MSRAFLAVALAAALFLPGCLGSVSPATIPSSALSSNGWRETNRDESGLAGGLAPATLIDYAPGGGGVSGLGSGITVATTVNLPAFDESNLIPMALERIEEAKGISFDSPTSRTLELSTRGVTVTGTEYVINGASVSGKGLVFVVGCEDFAVVAAWGASVSGGSGGGGLLGGGSSGGDNLYDEAIRVARTVQC